MLQIAAVLCYAVIIGGIAASIGIVFIDGAAYLATYTLSDSIALLLLPAAGGLLCAAIARVLPAGVFLGLADMVLTVQRGQHHKLRHHLLAALASFTALVSGASVGQYGPVAHLGGAVAAQFRRLPPAVAPACGIAAAIAAAFNAPVTAILFVHEVVLRHYSLRAFTPVTLSAVVGYSMSVGVFNRPTFLSLPAMQHIQPSLILLFIVMGVGFGILAAVYVRGIFALAARCQRVSLFIRLPLAGLITGMLAFNLPEISGGGQLLLEHAIGAPPPTAALLLFAAKLIATIICLGAGFAGGVVSPTLAIGALAGLLFYYATAGLLPTLPDMLPAAALALCGMMALTAPVLGAPLAAILFTMELSGSYPIAITAAITIAVAVQIYARLGGLSYYDRQLEQRGMDSRLRYDEWQLTTETIAPLIQPPARAGAVLPPTATVAAAIAAATDGGYHNIYIADAQGNYSGCVQLSAALAASDTATLHDIVITAEQPPPLSPDATIAEAIKKLQDANGASLAVVDEATTFLGVINESIILHRYHQIIAHYRHEQTAVT